jgi:hypothetical protein
MPDFVAYKSIPVGSLVDRSVEEEAYYLDKVVQMPSSVISMIMSPKTGAFLRGVLKSHGMDYKKCPLLAFAVLRFVSGDLSLNNLSVVISRDLGASSVISKKMVREIEHDLLAPIMHDLSNYL